MWRAIVDAWHYSDKVEYGLKGLCKDAVFGKRKRQALDVRKSLHLFSTIRSDNNLFKVDLHPYFRRFAGLPINALDFWRHSLVLGASGSGKSKFISQMVKQICARYPDKYHVLVLDPHADLPNDIGGLAGAKVFDFAHESIGLYDLENGLMAVEMMVLLFSDLLADQYNPKLERVLRHATALLLENQQFSFENFKRVLLEIAYRNELLRNCSQKSTTNFFLTDFTELKTRYHNEAIAPLVAFFDEMDALEIKGLSTRLLDALQYNRLSIVSLDAAKMSNRLVKIVANLIFQQVYLLAVSRKIENLIFVIDEVAMVDSPILAKMLSELRKFGVTIILSEQFFSQVGAPTRNAILANTANYFAFRLSSEDAALLEGNLGMKFFENDSVEQHQKMLTTLPDRKCVMRVMSGGKVVPAFAAETVDFAGAPYEVTAVLEDVAPAEERVDGNIVPLEIDRGNLRNIMIENSTARRKLL